MEHLVIIGNGIAGVTTARYVCKNRDMKITIISSETKHFFSRTALMYIYMGHMKFENTKPYEDWFWEKNRIDLVHGKVLSIDTDNQSLTMEDGESISYDKLVLATGSVSNKFGWPGQDLPGVQGLYSIQDVELLEENSKGAKNAVIIGGGLIGIELAEMLHSRGIHVTFIIRENLFWNNILPKEDATLVSRHILEHGMDIKFETNLKEIVAGDDGRVKSILTDRGEEIKCEIVGLTPGVSPNINFIKDSSIETGRGVLVNDFLETNIPNIFAAGDCIEIKAEVEGERNRFEQLWYTGRMHGEVLAKTICGNRTKYERGVWFNSAKFLDVEYQTYGFVSNVPREGEKVFYWVHSSGKKSLLIIFNEKDFKFVGMNVFGIRLRHKVFERWIEQNKTIDYILENLGEANFDPEFFKKHEEEIIEKFNSENPNKKLKLKTKKFSIKKFIGA